MKSGIFINNDFHDSPGGSPRELWNPATGKSLARVSEGDAGTIDAAVTAAKTAFHGGWGTADSRSRARIMLRIAGLLRDSAEDLAILESRNVGKPLRDSRDEVQLAADCFEYYAGAINKLGGETIPGAAAGLNMTFREPLGVCGIIVPWNFPLAISAWKTAPALAMGNTVVLKPAEQTPLTALKLAEICREAGLPAGVIGIVCGPGESVGEALVRHPQVAKIAFTGSTTVGRHIMRLAADSLKKTTLELGGKSANLIFADADLETAVPGSVWSVLGNAGQDCCARSRLLVERTVYPQVVDRMREAFQAVKTGDPLDEATEMGPLISTGHRESVLTYIRLGRDEGATLLCGGDIPTASPFRDGYFLNPAIFTDVKADMRIVREEIFGPVLCIMPFDSENEAVRMANDSNYALSGSIWTRDGQRALRLARRLEAGVLSINSGHSVHLEAPFGGFKESGIGNDLGMAVLEHYSRIKSVYYHIDP